jgi:long-chain fatty acid transport protein
MRRLAALALLVDAAAAAPALANPADAFGFGARAPAMGNAATAAAREAAANYYNPGALAVGDHISIDLGYQFALPHLDINGGDQDVDSSRGLTAGATIPGHIGALKLAFGVAVFLPDERLVRTRTLPSDRPRWMYYDNRPQRFFLGSTIALQLGNFYIGGGVAYMSKTLGSLDLNGRIGYPIADDSDLNLAIDVKLQAVRYPQAGILWRVTPWLDVGLTYRGGFVLELDQAFSVKGNLGSASNPIVTDAFFELQAIALDLYQPTEIALGAAVRATPRLTIAFDATYERWSTFENPSSVIAIRYDLKQFNSLVHIPAELPLEKAYYHDIVIPRLGVEVLAYKGPKLSLLARGGYSWEPSPAPEQRGETNFVDNDKHTLSAGLGLEVAGLGSIVPLPFDIDLYVAATLLPERTHRKLSPVDPVGDYASKGSVLGGGIATRWRF